MSLFQRNVSLLIWLMAKCMQVNLSTIKVQNLHDVFGMVIHRWAIDVKTLEITQGCSLEWNKWFVIFSLYTIYPVIFVNNYFSLFSRSPLHCKIFSLQKLYLVLFAVKNFKNREKTTATHFPIFTNFVSSEKNGCMGT